MKKTTMATTTTTTTTLTSPMVLVMLLLLLVQTPVATPASLGKYKSCLYECLNCVNTWGKELFNGERCAEQCVKTGGVSIDRTCTTYFTRSSRRVSAAAAAAAAAAAVSATRHHRQYLHSEDITGRQRHRLAGGYTNSYLGYRGQRNRNFGRARSPVNYRPYPLPEAVSRSTLSRDCQRLCRRCEARFTAGMDAHSCLYTCVRSKQAVVAC